MCIFNTPKTPAIAPAIVPVAAPTAVDSGVIKAADDTRRRAAGARGYDSTLLADPLGLGTANLKKQTLLGGATTQLG